MAEEANNNNAASVQQQPVLQLERCYFKDASLEMPHAPDIFVRQLDEQPTVDLQFEVTPNKLELADHYEVVVRATVTVKTKDEVLFLVEGKQAGIFNIAGFTEPQVHYLVNVNCASIVYPYLRANLADLVTRTTMPPVHIPEMNFEGLYQQRMAQQQAQAAGGQQGQAGGGMAAASVS